MNEKEIASRYSDLTIKLAHGNLNQALHDIINWARSTGNHDIADDAQSRLTAYGYMLNYYVQGINDPGRRNLYDELITRARSLADSLRRRLLLPESSRYYYSELRTQNHALPIDPVSLVANYRSDDRNSAAKLFNNIWTRFPLRHSDADALRAVILDSAISPKIAEMATYAVTMGLLEFYDEERFDLLASAAANSEPGVAAAGMIGLITALHRYRFRRHPQRVRNILSLAADDPKFIPRALHVVMEYARALGTPNLARSVQERLLPDIFKIQSDYFKKKRDRQSDTSSDTPKDDALDNFSELMEDESFSRSMRDFNEMMLQGDDVMFAMMSHAKTFPFFHEMAHWFLPFMPDSPALTAAFGNDDDSKLLAKRFEAADALCDSDKYSVIFTIAMMPADQRTAALQQYAQMPPEATTPPSEDFESAVNRQIHNLYRFYHLFRRHDDFINPFEKVVNPLDLGIFNSHIAEIEPIAKTIYHHRHFDEALRIFKVIDAVSEPDALRYNCMGYCSEQLGLVDNAIDLYSQAELLEPTRPWTLRHLAKMLELAGRNREAIDAYERLLALINADSDVLLKIGRAYLASGNYDEALMRFYEVERMAEIRYVGRDMALALLLTGDFVGAESYLTRAADGDLTDSDLRIMLHIHLKRGQIADAVGDIRTLLRLRGLSRSDLVSALNNDASAHHVLEIDPDELNLLLDAAEMVE